MIYILTLIMLCVCSFLLFNLFRLFCRKLLRKSRRKKKFPFLFFIQFSSVEYGWPGQEQRLVEQQFRRAREVFATQLPTETIARALPLLVSNLLWNISTRVKNRITEVLFRMPAYPLSCLTLMWSISNRMALNQILSACNHMFLSMEIVQN